MLTGCGNFFTSGDSIASATLSPVSFLTSTGQTVNYTATGTTVNGATQNINSSAKWSSSNTAVATVASGVATAVGTGTTTITVSEDDGSATASLIVSATALSSIAVTPTDPSVSQSTGSQQFKATGTFADGSTQDLTNVVQWTSGTTTVATINSTGLASLLTTGTTTITATVATSGSGGSVTNSTTLTVD